MDDCTRSDNEEANTFGTGKEVHKFFVVMVWYIGTVESSREQLDGSNTYTVWLEDVKYEEWYDEEIYCSNE